MSFNIFRYTLAEISFEDGKVDESLPWRTILDALKNAVKEVYGDYGLGCVQMSLKGSEINFITVDINTDRCLLCTSIDA